ncbi:MAG: MerR family transcriptional regulator [Parvularcula sp.]|nr:MerR family transcriptional regulator [Parvularcula sp.]
MSRTPVRKAPGAFRTISEASEEVGVAQHVLRHWEEMFRQVRPMRRAGGRRFYRSEDIDLLKGIRRLLHDEGYATKGVQKILKTDGVDHVAAIGRGEIAPSAAGVPSVTEEQLLDILLQMRDNLLVSKSSLEEFRNS